MYMQLENVVETLKDAKKHNIKCCVLIGAGCSVSAGIPTADGFVEIIKENFSDSYKSASQKTYKDCMAQLTVTQRRNLIADYVDQSKINWGHIALAQLMKEGYVDRVLTTNFDPLMARACTLVGIQPAVYDLPSSKQFNASMVSTPAIFHLHGQRSGFILINTDEEYRNQSQLIRPVIENVLHDHVWIVVGYSGENDPTLDLMVQNSVFEDRLFWVGFNENEPTENLHDLLPPSKDAHYIKGYDSDSFFGKLAGKLSCFPPEFVGKPFSYLDKLFDSLAPYVAEKTIEPIDYVQSARRIIREAIKVEGNNKGPLQAMSNLMGERYDKVSNIKEKGLQSTKTNQREVDQARVWALLLEGNKFYERAKTKTDAEADVLFKQACDKYAAALQIKPDFHEALNNWGLALNGQAQTKTGAEADTLFSQAYEKYTAALQIKPDKHEALNNWGSALSDQAKTKTGKEADDLFTQADEKHAAALQIKSDDHEALNNWGVALSDQANTKSGAEADALFTQADEKYAAALQIKSDDHEALNNWGNALSDQAKTKVGAEADALFTQADEKYAAALQIKSDYHEALNNWGNALSDQAKTKVGAEADALFTQAYKIFEKGESIQPGSCTYNLACAFSLSGKPSKCQSWLEKSWQYKELPELSYIESDSDLDPVRDQKWFNDFIEKVKKERGY